nr:MAG TPA: hypothetical protein [Caudoviricetes sp.]
MSKSVFSGFLFAVTPSEVCSRYGTKLFFRLCEM